jgi:hypothetical protein
MPVSAYFIIAKSALFPNTMARLMRLFNRWLPSRVSQEGNQARSGLAIRAGK